MTLADQFKTGTHEERIAYLSAVLQDFEKWFRNYGFTAAVKKIQAAYGSEDNLDTVFSYIVRDELRGPAVETARAFIGAFTNYYRQLKEQVRSVPVVGPALVERFFPF